MFTFLTRIVGVFLGFFILVIPAFSAEVKPSNYDIYIGDVNGDGASDYYFHQKPLFLILHGDIATPISIKQLNSFAIYRNGSGYSAATLLTLTDAELSQKLTSGILRPAVISEDFFIWNSSLGAKSHIFLRGADISAPSIFLTTTINDALPVFAQTYAVESYPSVSDRNVPVRIEDVNKDGFSDVVLGSYNSPSGETAYLADSNGVPISAFEVTAASTLPSALLNTDDGVFYHVGTVGGEFRVNESGAANYTIPIQLPQGTAGVNPQVSINYSSGSGIGLMGKGWSLTAFSIISRCRQTLSQDGSVKPITWTSTDRFCLDGQRLILISGTYGADNSTYKTEIDNFATITAVGTVSDGSGYFKSIAKDGSTTFYGITDNSKFYNATGGVSTTLTWAQSRLQDNVGNGVDYVYEGDSTTGQRLKNIYYAYPSKDKTPSSVPQSGIAKAVVTFNYENRQDISSVYVTGYEFKQTKRLYQVIVQNNSAELRRYNFSYMSAATTETRYDNKISRLERIRECVGPSNCFMPTTFMWGGGSHLDLSQAGSAITFDNASSGKYVLNHFFANLTGNGKQDLVYLMFESGSQTSATLAVRIKYADTALSSTIYFYNKNYNNFRMAGLDYNADGRQDLAIYDGATWKIYLSTPRSDNTWKIDGSSTIIDSALTDKDTSFIDVNSDGLADAVNGSNYRLLSRNTEPATSNKAYSFGSSANFSWGDMANYPGLSDPVAGPNGCSNIGYKTKLNPTKTADFNGDGIVDFIGDYIKSGYCSVGAPTSQYIERPNPYALVVSGNTVSNYGNIRLKGADITPVDINGDGLSDITYRLGNNIYYMINNGAGFNADVLWVTLPSYSSGPLATPQFVDINGDGMIDIVWANRTTGKLNARLWGGATDIVVRDTVSTGQNDSHLIMDISGDGILDYLRVTSSALTTYKGTLAVVGADIPCYYMSTPVGVKCVGGVLHPSIPVPENEQHTNIYSVDNGLGNITKISYGTLSNSQRYETTELKLNVTTQTLPTGCPQNMGYPCAPTYTSTVTDSSNFYSRLNGGWDLPSGSATLVSNNATKGNPVLEVNGSTPIVITVESSAPSAGATANNINENGMSKVDYYYSEAKLQASGRGFLGFKTLKTVDAQTDITTVTTYRQDFPFIGNPLATVVYKNNSSDATILSKAVNSWKFTQNTGLQNTKYFQTSIGQIREYSYDFANGAELQSINTVNEFDNYGNLTYSAVETSGKKANGSAVTTLVKKVLNKYGTTTEYKKFGRLTEASVTTGRDDESTSTRSSSFTYYEAGDPKGAEHLLKTEKVDAGSLAATTITYEYDSFGNKNKIITTASDTLEARSITQNFGSDGRYLVSSTNDLNQSSVINERNNFGNIKSATDINNLQSQIFYDSMGAEYLRKDASGAWSRVDTNFCNTTNCPSSAKYRVYKRVAGGGKSYEYYDQLGRVIRSSKVGFDGTLHHIDTEYDNVGRIKRQSVPFSGEAAQYWTENTYDHLGRVVSVKAPDLSETSTVYAGNKSTLTNSLNQTREEYRNGLGLLEKVEDQLDGTVEYEYDFYGNLIKAKTTADGTAVSVRICYDGLGHKVAMHDPDKGGFVGNASLTCDQVVGANPKKAGWWYYSYNAFGELVEQTDPKGQKVKNHYDALGRMIGRIDYLASGAIEGFSQWFYEGGVGTHNPVVKGKLTATLMNTATNLSTSQVESFIQTKTASCNENSGHCHKVLYDFDIFGQPVTNTIYYPGSSTAYTARTQYDSFGRVYLQYDALDRVIKDLSGKLLDSGIQIHYNIYGYPYKTTDVATGKTLQLTQETNVLGQVTKELRGNGLISVNTYDIRTGLLTNQKTLNSLNLSSVQNNAYGWDAVGNLTYRQNLSGKPGTPFANNSSVDSYGQAESFCYDGLNRLIKTNANTTSTSACNNLTLTNQDVRYDGQGNIKYKKDVGDYTYASSTAAGPHAVTSVGSDSGTYTYDYNGNNTYSAGRELKYTSYDMVKSIDKAGKKTEFKYGIGRDRWQRVDATATTIYMGNIERIQTVAANIEWKRNVAGVVFTYRTDSSNNLQTTDKRYIYTDHLGSVDLLTDANGEVQGQLSKVSHAMSFDAWGNRRNIAQWNPQNFTFALSSITVSGFAEPITRRGFTGHEMVDDMGIIHMNGRIYDPKLARFLQADPFIQAATNTQSYNRYSYLWNNPLNATDPSGFFLKQLHKNIMKIDGSWATHKFLDRHIPQLVPFIQAGLNFIPIVGTVVSAAFGANHTFYLTGSLTSGVKSFAMSYGASSIGAGIADYGLNTAQTIFAQAMLGGVMAELQGGKFGHGFVSAGLSAGAGAATGTGFSAQGMVVSAVVGGTVSEITGGKFANGAQSAAMMYAVMWAATRISAGGVTAENSSSSGNKITCNPINIATGEKYLTMTDYKAEGASQMTFERYYSSYASEKTSMGIGWRSNFDRGLKIEKIGDITLRVVAVRHQGDSIIFNWISADATNDGHWKPEANRHEIIRKSDAGWELLLTDNSREIYDADGRLVEIRQLDGYIQTLTYGDQGTVKNVLLQVTDNVGQRLKFGYDLQARMISMAAADGSVTRYEYDQHHNLAKVISPDDTAESLDNSFVVYDYNDSRFKHAITGIRNSNGQRIHSMAYDNSGRAVLSALGDDAERVDMTFTAGENNTKHTLVKNSLGKNTLYTFDKNNNPLQVEGQPTATCIGSNQGYEYNDNGQLISKTDWNGALTRYEYNDRGLETLRVEAVDTKDERQIVTEWHSQWRLPVRITTAGLVVELRYNPQGQIQERVERDTSAVLEGIDKLFKQYPERIWNYSYNSQGLVVAIDGPRSDEQDVTQFEYDANGNRVAVINALGHRSDVLAINERGLPLQVRDANGLVTELAYNSRGWLVSKIVRSEKGDSITQYHYSGISDYNNQGLVSAMTLPNGEEIAYEYDNARRLIAQSNKAGERLEYTLDLEGNRVAQRIYNSTGALAFNQSQVFDELSRLLQSIGADGSITRFGYDKSGNRTSSIDALEHRTGYAFDALNRLITTTDALDGEVTQTYDAANRVTSITDQRGLTTQYRYNGFGNKIAQVSPDTGETRYGYDQAGNMISKTDARGVLTEYRYDALGRVIDVIYPAANDDNIHYHYDDQKQSTNSIGRVSSIRDASGAQVYSYNEFGQVTALQSRIGLADYKQSYDYDRNGQLVAQQYPSGRRVNYKYDAQGRLGSVETEFNNRSETVLTQMHHQPFGPLATLGYGNGTQLQIAQDNNYRIRTQQLMNASNDAIYHRGYDYDKNSNIVGITDYNKPTSSQVFAYDALSRLTDATGNYGSLNYGYDAVGNRISRTQNNRLENYTYADNSNRLLSVISESEQGELQTRRLGYDAVGNITNDSADINAKILGFGANNRLEQVKISHGDNEIVAAYQYNAKGQRVIKQVNGKTIHFHYDTDNRLLAETTETGKPIRDYIYAANQRIALVDYQQNAQGIVYFMVNDHLGTPQLLLGAQQQVVWSVDQSPFGEVKVEGNIEQPLRFPGQYADAETGYSYNYFRDYDPTLGRYIESDPIGLDGGANTFAYVLGNPIGAIDMWGLDPYLVSRPLADDRIGWGFHHNFIVVGAKYLGDPSASVISWGKTNYGSMGRVYEKGTLGMSADTFKTDRNAWLSLAKPDGSVTYRSINASDSKVLALALSVDEGIRYSPIPELMGGVNSNSAAGRVAHLADDGYALVAGGAIEPGASIASHVGTNSQCVAQ